MTDAHAEIRKALAAGPTRGPWRIEPLKYVDGHAIWSGKPGGRDEYRVAGIGGCVPTRDQSEANAALICACNPEAIRALLAERDALEADRDSWAQQASDRIDDAVKFAKERDAMERNRDMWKEQCHRQARELEAMHMAMRANIDVLSLEAIDSAIAASGAGKDGRL